LDNFSDGSSSNPSFDNLDMKDMFDNVYQIKSKKDFQFDKEEASKKFLEEIMAKEVINQQ